MTIRPAFQQVTALGSDAVDREFEPRSVQTKDYKVGICCFSDKHTALRRKNKCSLARNQDNASEWGGCLTPTQQYFCYIMARTS
jgi:hypothetical protein